VTRQEKDLLKRLRKEGPTSFQGNDAFKKTLVSLRKLNYCYKIDRVQGVQNSWGGGHHQDDQFEITPEGRAALSTDWGKWGCITAVIGLFATIATPQLSASQVEYQKSFGPWSVLSQRDLGQDGEPYYFVSMTQNSDLNDNELGNTIHMEWSSGSKTIRIFFSVFHCDGDGSLFSDGADVALSEWLAPDAKVSGAGFRQRLAGLFSAAKAQLNRDMQYHKKACTLGYIESRFKMKKFDRAWTEFLDKVRTYSSAKGGAK
jgi:hypothetical protein